MMLGFGILGYIMTKLKYPIVPLVLGRLSENSLRKGMYMTDYQLYPFLMRPIAGTILVISICSVLWNLYSVFVKKGKASLEEIE